MTNCSLNRKTIIIFPKKIKNKTIKIFIKRTTRTNLAVLNIALSLFPETDLEIKIGLAKLGNFCVISKNIYAME